MGKQKKTKVLVVEDDSLFLWTLDHFLSKEGYDVSGVATAELAFDLAQRQSFDVVISDFHLPGLNGRELIKKVKALQPKAKAILISAYQREEVGDDDQLCLNAYLNKPIELELLSRILRNLKNSRESVKA